MHCVEAVLHNACPQPMYRFSVVEVANVSGKMAVAAIYVSEAVGRRGIWVIAVPYDGKFTPESLEKTFESDRTKQFCKLKPIKRCSEVCFHCYWLLSY